MRTNNVLLLFVLTTISFSNAFELTKLAEVKELRSSSYGNSLIETISLTLENNGSINEVQKLLDNLLYNLNKDQENADKEWAATEKRLKDQIEALTLQIVELEKEIAIDEKDLKTNEEKRDQAERNLKQYEEQLAANDHALKQNEENREKDEAEFKNSTREHNDVVNAIEAVVKELEKLVGSVSGKGRPVHVEEIAAEKRDKEHEEAHLKKAFIQLTRDEEEAIIFAELATTADQAALAKLIELLNGLRTSTEKSLNDDVEHEQNSKKHYENLKNTLNNDNEKLRKVHDEQTKNHTHYVAEVQRLKNKLDEERKLKASKEKERVDTEKELKDKETQYKADKAERDHERTVIKRLQKIVEERLANMSKFLRQHAGAF